MLGLILGIAIPLLYFLVGYKLAVMDMPRQWELNSGGYDHSFAKSEVLIFSALTFFAWPIRGPLVLMSRAADRHDPERIRRQARRIKELERELGINEGSNAYSDPYGRFRGEDDSHYRRPYRSR